MSEKPNTVEDPGRIDELARQMRDGILSSADLVRRYLDRIAAVEPQVAAWREVCAEAALTEAAARDREIQAGTVRGPLHGIPVGVKDIIDVAGVPTRCNSLSREDAAPAAADAEVVAALRTAGAVVLGKTHTTEFAFRDPSPARNPYNLEHTPGGSSSGSGAAVGAGMVPAALGTQTMASVNRPAAYCGIAAFKPSTGLMCGGGVAPLSYYYDTVGYYGWNVADAASIFEAICPLHARVRSGTVTDAPLSIVVLQDPFIDGADADIHKSVDEAEARLRDAGHDVERRASPVSIAELHDLHTVTMEFDIGHTRKALLDEPQGMVGEHLCEAIRRGLEIPEDTYFERRRRIEAARHVFFNQFPGTDAFLWPATPKTAPKGLEWTGDASYISPWTTLGGPVVTMPAGLSSEGMPIGCLLAGAPGTDYRFASIARRIADAAERHS